MHLEAWTELMAKYCIGGDLVLAAPQRIICFEELYQSPGVHHGAIRTEIAGAVFFKLAGKEDLGKFVIGHTYPRIGLGVLEQDIVLWLILLDKVILEQQRISLAIHHRILHICNLGDQNTRLGVESGRVNKVLGYSLVEIFSLSYIYDIPLGVIVSVNSGGMW